MGDEGTPRRGVPIGRAWPAGPTAAGDERGVRDRRGRSPDPSSTTRRLFVAVPLGEAALQAVGGLVAELRVLEAELGAAVRGRDDRRALRWVRPDGVHVTLSFLGPTPSWLVENASVAVEAAADCFGSFTVRVAGAGAFPRSSAPRVLWLGIDEGADRLREIAGQVEVQLAAEGWDREVRPFTAHLTLARANDPVAARPVAEALVRRASTLDVRWTADRVVLYESHPGPGGSRYTVVKAVPLAG